MVMVADIKKIIYGDMDIHIAPVSTSEPLLATPYRQAVAGSGFTDTYVIALMTRGTGTSLYAGGGTGAYGSTPADLSISTADGATSEITINTITWDPSIDNGLVVNGLLPQAATAGGFGTEIATGGVLESASMYIHFEGETAEFLTQTTAQGGDVAATTTDYIDSTTAGTTSITFHVPTSDSRRAVLNSIMLGEVFRFRVANSGGTEADEGSNPLWLLLGDALISEDGIAVSYQQTTEPQRILRETIPVAYYRTAEEFTVTATLLDYTVDTQALLMNNRAVSEVAATAANVGYRQAVLERGATIDYRALLVRMPSPYMIDGEAQLYFPKMFVSSPIEYTLSKTASGYPVTFSIVRDEIQGFAAALTAQTAARL